MKHHNRFKGDIMFNNDTAEKTFEIGSTSVKVDIETWSKHGCPRIEIRILCVDDPFSDYDALRDWHPTKQELKEALNWIIENEGRKALKGYTDSQLVALQKGIVEMTSKR